jgi:predicted dehydrogenase
MSNGHSGNHQKKIRYAVVGLGHIAQSAVLPAFRHAAENSQVTALVSNDPQKLKELGKKYKVTHTYSYDEYEACLKSGEVDAVYIALPNHMHCEFTVRAAKAGRHVLCEKPMAVTESECQQMIDACHSNHIKLMIAYRLHFEEANLKAVHLVQSRQIGEPRFFTSTFSMQVRDGDIRLRQETGGGTLYDIGIYCINAARNLFRDEPIEVFATSGNSGDRRFKEVDETTTAVMRFPNGILADFTTSFGAADVSTYRVGGTEGDLRLEPAYEYAGKLIHYLTQGSTTRKEIFSKRDQFAPELIYFSRCILDGKDPEPSGLEGMADVRIIEAMYRSVAENRPVQVEPISKDKRPTQEQQIRRPAVAKPQLVNVESPSL